MTHKIRSWCMSETDVYGIHRDTHQDTYYLEPYLQPRVDTPKPPRYVSRMYPACIPHISHVYLDYLLGYMYLACISHVSRLSPSYQIHLSLDAFDIHVSHHVSWMYPACILITHLQINLQIFNLQIHVSRMYPACILHLRYVPRHDASRNMYRDFVSRLYLGVSWCIISCMFVMKSPRYTKEARKIHIKIHPRYISRYMYLQVGDQDTCGIHPRYISRYISWSKIHTKMYPDVSWYVSSVTPEGSAQDTCILMYLMCIPKCILDSFGIRVKYMQNVLKIHVYSLGM